AHLFGSHGGLAHQLPAAFGLGGCHPRRAGACRKRRRSHGDSDRAWPGCAGNRKSAGALKGKNMPGRFRLSALACALVAVSYFAAPARAEVNEVRIGVQFGLIYLPVVVADAQGFFAEEAKKAGLPELKVTVQRFSGSPAITD